jgi:hypothetical protein
MVGIFGENSLTSLKSMAGEVDVREQHDTETLSTSTDIITEEETDEDWEFVLGKEKSISGTTLDSVDNPSRSTRILR